MKKLQRKITLFLLDLAQTFFLESYGWKNLGNDEWMCPDYYDERKKTRTYRGGHALNAQRYYNAHNVFFEKERAFDGD